MANRLFAFVAVTAGTLVSIAIASIAHVNGGKRTVLTIVVMTATSHGTANTLVYSSFNHDKYLLSHTRLKKSMGNFLIFY